MVIIEANPRAAGFIPIPRRERGHFDRAALTDAVGHGFRIVRWHPVDARSSQPHSGG
jgi:hypothetical protein